MKKIVLSLAAVMAAAAFAPEASAVPVFARQTGMACSACHYQHFPLLNSFGRAFKASGFTMMGAQAKVEGEHISIPANLNLGVLTTLGYSSVSGANNSTTAGSSTWFVPGSGGELSLFVGGRASEFAGWLSEIGAAGAAGLGAGKLALLFPIGDTRMGIVAYTGSQGAAYSYELLNTGAADTHKMVAVGGDIQGGTAVLIPGVVPVLATAPNKHTGVYSAASYLGTKSAATGLSFVATNPNLGFINVGKYEAAGVGTPTAGTLPLTYLRLAGIFNAGGMEMGVGLQSWSGTSKLGANMQEKATVLDFQLQGDVGMPLGVYASYGSAPAIVAGTNTFNAGNVTTKKSINVGAELGVVPGVATVQLGYRSGKNGNAAGTEGDNGFLIGATYELAQNIELSLTHSSNSGSAWNAPVQVGKTMTTLMLETLF